MPTAAWRLALGALLVASSALSATGAHGGRDLADAEQRVPQAHASPRTGECARLRGPRDLGAKPNALEPSLVQVGATPSEAPCQEDRCSGCCSNKPCDEKEDEVEEDDDIVVCECASVHEVVTKHGLGWVAAAKGTPSKCSVEACVSELSTHAVASDNPDKDCKRRCRDKIDRELKDRCMELVPGCTPPKPVPPTPRPICSCSTARHVIHTYGDKWVSKAKTGAELCEQGACVKYFDMYLVESPRHPDDDCVEKCRRSPGKDVKEKCRELARECVPPPPPSPRPPPCDCRSASRVVEKHGHGWESRVKSGSMSCRASSCIGYLTSYVVRSPDTPSKSCIDKCSYESARGLHIHCHKAEEACRQKPTPTPTPSPSPAPRRVDKPRVRPKGICSCAGAPNLKKSHGHKWHAAVASGEQSCTQSACYEYFRRYFVASANPSRACHDWCEGGSIGREIRDATCPSLVSSCSRKRRR